MEEKFKEMRRKGKAIRGKLGPNWRKLDSNVTSKEIGPIKDILSNSARIGGNLRKLPWEAFPDVLARVLDITGV
jgi:hypothetical protein